MRRRFRFGIATAAMAAIAPLAIQAVGAACAAEPSDHAQPASPPPYRSVFDGYQRWSDDPKASWRESNDAVGRMGGHMGHAGDTDTGTDKPATDAPPAGGRPAGVVDHSHHRKP